jgi:hypothetical protein
MVQSSISLAFRKAAEEAQACAEPIRSYHQPNANRVFRSYNQPTGDGDHTSVWESAHFQAQLRRGASLAASHNIKATILFLLYLNDFH